MSQVIGYVNGDKKYPFTQSDMSERAQNKERVSALHESSHAVAAWMLGEPIMHMKFNTADSPSLGVAVDFAAETGFGIALKDMMAKSAGERLVHGLQYAFITLAGIFGSGEVNSDNPLDQIQVKMHGEEAVGILVHIAGISGKEARKEGCRLLPIVNEIFADPRVQETVKHLAKNFMRLRDMSGEEVTACIAQAWTAFDKAYKEASEAEVKA